MKTLLKIVAVGWLGGLSLGVPSSALAKLEVAAVVQINARADFDVPLALHGSWVQVPSYGRCWRPASVVVGWRPYCNGTWVWTDCGWYWQSDEPWAWACYHYGTWVYESDFGWVWIPGIEWAPAWVRWRVGGGFIGWAPRPPHGAVIAGPFFSFVALGQFHDRVRPASVVINDTTIFKKTREITEVKRVSRAIGGTRQEIVINEGPGVAEIQKATGKKVSPVPIQEAVRQTVFPQLKGSKTGAPTDKAQSASPPQRHYKTENSSGEPQPRPPEGKDKKNSDKPKGKAHDEGKP